MAEGVYMSLAPAIRLATHCCIHTLKLFSSDSKYPVGAPPPISLLEATKVN